MPVRKHPDLTDGRLVAQNPSVHFMTRPLVCLLSSIFATAIAAESRAVADRLLVSSSQLGPDGPGIDAEAFARGLQSRGFPNAVAMPTAANKPDPQHWWRVPTGIKREEWVSVVTTGFGKRGDAYAFMFAGPDGAVSSLVHHPYTKFQRWGSWVWPEPLPGLLDAFTRGLPRSSEAERPLLALDVRARAADDKGGPPTLDPEGDEEDEVGTEALSKVQGSRLLPPVVAMTWAGAWQGGWAPTRGAAKHRISVEVDFGLRCCSFLARYAGPLGEAAMLRHDVSDQDFQLELQRLFLFFRRQRDLRHYGRLPAGGIRLMAADGRRLCYEKQGVLFGFDTARDQLQWPQIPEKGKLPKAQSFASRLGSNGQREVFRWSGLLAVVDPQTGEERQLLPQGAAHAYGFVSGGDESIVIGQGEHVRCFRAGEQVWGYDAGSAVSAGPILAGERVIFGCAAGELGALHAGSGKLLWQSSEKALLHPEMILAGPHVVGFDRQSEAVCAWRIADGGKAWVVPLGDVLLQLAAAASGRILAAAKNNRIVLIDAHTGKLCHERVWHTWPLQVVPFVANNRGLVAITDLDGTLTILDQTNLQNVRTIEPFADFAGNMLYVDKLAVSRPESFPDASMEGMDLTELGSAPSLVVTDREGFYYVLGVEDAR